MAFADLHRSVVARLEEGDRGDRGWWLTTRVHLNGARLREVARYLNDVAEDKLVRLETEHYAALARLAGVTSTDPGITLRRHLLLAMETPLRLLQRADGHSWREVSLTPLGIELATTNDANAVLERALNEIVFCRQPYYTESREEEYGEFDIHPYRATAQVLRRCDGWIDRDEYDLFLSRIRREREIAAAIRGIREFRVTSQDQRNELLREVRIRVPGAKRYQNWRDMGLHTFSLFILVIRTGQVLRLTRSLTEVMRRPGVPPRRMQRAARRARQVALRMPTPPPNAGLMMPPAAREPNAGSDGELLVAKLLDATGWTVVFYTNRRGFGFDLWARKEESVIVVEVKSAFGRLGSITFTRLEHDAALRYAENFYLAVVENVNDNPTVRFIQDPARLHAQERQTREFVLPRDIWEAAVAAL
jgi:Holliday junction resolvase-like predicted endonuclease